MSIGELWTSNCSSWACFKSRIRRKGIEGHTLRNLHLWYPIYPTSFLHTYLMNSLSIWSYFSSLIYLVFIKALLMLRNSSHLDLLFIRSLLWHSMHFYFFIWRDFSLIMLFWGPPRENWHWVLSSHFYSRGWNSTFVWEVWNTGSGADKWGPPLIAFFETSFLCSWMNNGCPSELQTPICRMH